MGLAILGCGRHGERYLRHIAAGDVAGARVVVIQRRSRELGESLAARYAVDYVEEENRALEDPRVQAVIVASPPGLHAQSLRRLEASPKPVLCEKPVAGDLAQLAMVSPAQRDRVMVAQTLRYHPTLIFGRSRRESLGPVHFQRWSQRLEPSDLSWQRDPALAGGGSVLLTGVHLFDQIRWWWGRTPDSVVSDQLSVQGHPLENLFTATFHYRQEERIVSAEVAKCSSSRCARLETVGTRGQCFVDYLGGEVRELRATQWEKIEAPPARPTLPAILEDFLAFAREERDNPIPLEEGVETLRMAEACYLAHREGRRVDLTEIPGLPSKEAPPGGIPR